MVLKMQVAIFFGLQVATPVFFAYLHSYSFFQDCLMFRIVIKPKVKWIFFTLPFRATFFM